MVGGGGISRRDAEGEGEVVEAEITGRLLTMDERGVAYCDVR